MYITGVLSQTTIATIYPGDITSDGNLRGEIIGTGADGTTYRIAATISGVVATGLWNFVRSPRQSETRILI